MIRKLALLAVLFTLVGCTAKTTSEEWKQYARGSYLHGVADGKAEALCPPTVAVGSNSRCDRARLDAAAIKEVAPQVDYTLTNNRPERQRHLMRYIELGSGAAK
jgi:hypothetical protein